VPHRLTLAQAETILIDRNLPVAASRYQVEASRAARLIAAYKPNPVLTLGMEEIPFASPVAGSVPRFFSSSTDAASNPVFTLRIDKIVERGGKREARIGQADHQVKAAEAQMLDSIRVQLFQLRQAFTAATLARENLLFAEAAEKQYEQTNALTQIKVENGDLPGVEGYRARSGLLQYQQTVLQTRTAYDLACLDVLNLLGATASDVEPAAATAAAQTPDGAGRIERVSSGDSEQAADSFRNALLEITGALDDRPLTKGLSELREDALLNRPDVAVARENFEASKLALKGAEAQRARDIDLGFEYQRVGQDHTAGVLLSFPIFAYNNQRSAAVQARALQDAAEKQLRQVEHQALTDVEKAYQAYLAARRTLELYRSENLAPVEKLREIATFGYREGASSLFELLDAQRTYNHEMAAYNQARSDYQLSLWQIEQAVGTPLR
jgi:cobalt-zinc-cadmium efflux system outer membrane protein